MRTFYYLLFSGLLFFILLPADVYSAQNIRKTDSAEKLLNKITDRLSDTIFVAPPTGEREKDRASIIAAIEQVQPEGIIQFATGTYMVGKGISVKVPGVTLLGHPEGTIIRGCDPAEMEDRKFASVNCNGMELAGSNQTVRGFTFEYAYWALHLGCCRDERIMYKMPDGTSTEGSAIYNTKGGHLVEDNTFRYSMSGIRMNGDWKAPAIVRNNHFINNWHGVSINGNTVHLIDNFFSVPEPEKIPSSEFALDAVKVGPPIPMQGVEETYLREGSGNIVSNNKIEGSHQGISISVYEPGTGCRNNVIRNNKIKVRRAKVLSPENFTLNHELDSTFVGVPVALLNFPEALDYNAAGQESFIENNIIEGNEITGAEGLGIEILNSSNNQISNNHIQEITVREPFPGNVMDPRNDKLEWEKANGSGIWISPGSNGNEIVGNTFKDIASYALFLEGDSNQVEVHKAGDSIRDVGKNNLVIQAKATPDTTRYTILIDNHRKAERLQWKEAPNTWGYEYRGDWYDSYHYPRIEQLVLDTEGFPLKMEISGQRIFWDQWFERFERTNGRAQWTVHSDSKLGREWSRKLDEGEAEVSGPIYYNAVHPVHDHGVLARLLLNQTDKKLPLLPNGTAQLELINQKKIEAYNDQRTISLYAIHGLDLRPVYVWLDEDNETFADEWSIRAGWEDGFSELRTNIEEALAAYHHRLVKDLIPPVREKPLVIHRARLFDPETHLIHSGTTIIIKNNRISAIGPDDSLQIPSEAEMIDAMGQMAVPGLWDMHTHHGISEIYLELMAPLNLAGGITTARDLGSPTEPMLSLRKRIKDGEALGSRLLLAGWIEGGEGRPTGPLVKNAAEARAVVDRFAELGYVQIKIYNTLPPDLVQVVIERAKKHGLRVSGHIPQGMTWQEAIEMGYNEIQHLGYLIEPLLSKSLAGLNLEPTPELLEKYNKANAEITTDSEEVQEIINLLAHNNIGVDPTLTLLDAQGLEAQPWMKRIVDRFPSVARRQILDLYLFGYWPLSPLKQETFDNRRDIVRALHEAGVPILPGSDMEIAGFGLHRELEIYTEAGIPAPEILTLATLGAARVMGMDNELGSIEPGKLADLILIDGDPTINISDISRVMTVIKDGRVYDPAAIYRALGIEPCCEE